MESRIRSVFLGGLLLTVLGVPGLAMAQSPAASPVPEVIDPQVDRRAIRAGAIDTEDFEIGAFIGIMSVEDFETNAVYGLRLAYHISEYFFAEASYGTTSVGRSSFEKLGGGAELLTDRDLSYYDLSLGYNLFPGEVFLGSQRAYNSSVYLIGGLGTTDFAGDSRFTLNFGFGIKVLPTDWLAVRLDVRDYLFDIDISGTDKTTHNLQATLNVSYFF